MMIKNFFRRILGFNDIPSVVVDGQKYDAEAVEVLKDQIATGVRQVHALVDEMGAKDDMIDAMIVGFGLRRQINSAPYNVGSYDWSLVVHRIKMSEADEDGTE